MSWIVEVPAIPCFSASVAYRCFMSATVNSDSDGSPREPYGINRSRLRLRSSPSKRAQPLPPSVERRAIRLVPLEPTRQTPHRASQIGRLSPHGTQQHRRAATPRETSVYTACSRSGPYLPVV